MNFKETFLELTEYTTPFKSETDFEKFLTSRIDGLQKDQIGNYHKIIGESETLFTCHLDNYCKEKEKVNHVITDNIIATDETTVLGGDNKAGVLAILYLISNNVPGHYCFFIGEEPILSGGLYGSTLFAEHYIDMVKDYKRAIAFDRKQMGSIITRQSAQYCCSEEFTNELIERFAEQGLEMQADPTGYYTDTSSFMEIIPECTNISIGVWGEHTFKEYVDIEYTEKVAIAASKIDWESLPTNREPIYWLDESSYPKTGRASKRDENTFNIVRAYLSGYNFMCMNRTGFHPSKTMTFNHWFKEFKLEVTVIKNIARINGRIINIDFKNEKDPINDDELKAILMSCREDVMAKS